MSLAVANRYARALSEAVMAPGSDLDPQAAVTALRDFAATLDNSVELRTILTSPAVQIARKRSVVSKLCDAMGSHKLLRNFLSVVLDHRRVGEIREIVAAFEAAIDERMGRVRAEVSSSAALTGPDEEALRAQLARMTGKQVRCEFTVKPELIGGASVRIGSTIYDGSVRGQLEAMAGKLSAGK